MKIASFLVGTGLVLLSVEALRLEKRTNPAIFKIPLRKRTHGIQARSLSRRQEVETPDLNYMNQLLYIVQLQIGTPPQETYVQLDTGSSDLVYQLSFYFPRHGTNSLIRLLRRQIQISVLPHLPILAPTSALVRVMS
jgi:hypothetical protein